MIRYKSWLELVFLRNEIKEKWGWDEVLAAKNEKCERKSDYTLIANFLVKGNSI